MENHLIIIFVVGVVGVCLAFMLGKNKGLAAATNPFEMAKHKLRTNNHPWSHKSGVQIVEAHILKILEDKQVQTAIVKGLQNDGLYDPAQPDIIVAFLLNKYAWDLVSTGRYHLYRGILNPVGEGMRDTVLSTTQYLVDQGKLTEEMANNWRSVLHADIRQAG